MTTTIKHPLEPLTAQEVALAVTLLKDAGKVTPTTRFVSVSLKEPAKELVHAFNGEPSSVRSRLSDDNQPAPYGARLAFAVLFDNATNSCYETTLSLTDRKLLSWKHVPGVQPTMTSDEQVECEQAVLASPEFKAALKKQYGIDDTSLVMVDIWSAGNYGTEEDRTRRLARPLCFLRVDPTDNGYAKPIEGLRPVVDLNTMKVIRVEEYGHWPLPPQQGNYAADRVTKTRTDIKPLDITQPEGPSFEVDGYCVRWQKWSFVIGFNAREGLVLHNLCYHDDNGREGDGREGEAPAEPSHPARQEPRPPGNSKKRSILYRGSLSEMVVPYGDPAPQQARKNAFDAGEYGLGYCANSLELGCDCLGVIKYFDGHLCTSRGDPLTIKNAVCMHEEDFGILWKHTDRRLADKPEVRRSRRLVISSIATVENYEYGFFWYLYQDGNIQFEIKLTGILSLGALHPGEKSPYGTLIAPQLYAPNHQHFFNMRLDMDLDGTANSVYQVDIVPGEPGDHNPFGNAFSARATLLETEAQSKASLNLETARTWKIVNPNVLNAVGEPVGYKFFPGDNCVPFASKHAWWRKRAGFVDHHVWVTPFKDNERHAAGDYPNQSQGGDGLPKWTAENRAIANTDVVFWYTFGHTHIPRPEDYPVMPTAFIGFMLKPNGFFSENPANDVPPSAKKAVGTGKTCCGSS